MRRQAAGHWGTLPAKSDDPLLVRLKILFNTAWVTTIWSPLALAPVFWTLYEPQSVNVSGATNQIYDIFQYSGTYGRSHNIATISWALLVWVAPFRHSTRLVLALFTISPWPNVGTFLLTQLFMGRNLIKLFRRNQGLLFPKRIFLHIKSFLSFIMQLDYWDSCSWTWP